MHTLSDLPTTIDRVFIRLDLNVPIKDGKILDATRIDKIIPTLNAVQKKAKILLLATHLGRPKPNDSEPSTKILIPLLEEKLNQKVFFLQHDAALNSDQPGIYLMENIRFLDGETQNDSLLAKKILRGAEFFINDAFSCSHRAHASVCAVCDHAQTFAGLQMEQELFYLGQLIKAPQSPFVAIVGGAKISTKMDVLQHLLKIVDTLIVGGAMANTFLKAKGLCIGGSLYEEAYITFCQDLMNQYGQKIVLPLDYKVGKNLTDPQYTQYDQNDQFDGMILDIGEKSVEHFQRIIDQAKTLCWNGPVGAYEYPPYNQGSQALAQHIAKKTQSNNLLSVIGGGDTIAVINALGLLNDFAYVSTAGGAFLEYLEGKKLPGLFALK
ncbi:MAG: Phosphoglycerate kinase [Holosporales bacterium]